MLHSLQHEVIELFTSLDDFEMQKLIFDIINYKNYAN